MITNEQIDLLIERLINRVDKANTYFLIKIGEKIKKIGSLKPTEAQQLIQILKYNGDIDEIMQELAKYSNLNLNDIEEIFNVYAKKDQYFYKQFYEYKNIPFVDFTEHRALKRQTEAIANMVAQQMYSFTRNSVLGYTIKDNFGNVQFLGLRETYDRVLEEAFLNVSQGKETFDIAMSHILEDIGGSGLKTIEYQSGRSIRLDSAIRMHLQDGLRLLHNENQKIIGEEFGYNGIEVTHHLNAAPDHIDTIDGKQFALIDKIQEQINKGIEKEIELSDIKGNYVIVKSKRYQDFNSMNESLDRKVSTLNCRHTTFSIIVGVSKPQYTDEQLQKDREKNLKGFELDGKHYTLYEGEQLQRQLERKVRQQKDIQILAKASGNEELISQSQSKITQYTRKYKELCNISGLKPYMERMKVSGYKRTKTDIKPQYQMEYHKKKYTKKEIYDLFNETNKELDNETIMLSKWSGKLNINDSNPAKEWDCSITISDKTVKQEIQHELLHARSISYYGKEEYINFQYEEESVVEFFNKQILEKNNIKYYDNAYINMVNNLEKVSDELGIDRYQFARDLFEIRPSKRESFIISKTNTKNINNIKNILKETFLK